MGLLLPHSSFQRGNHVSNRYPHYQGTFKPAYFDYNYIILRINVFVKVKIRFNVFLLKMNKMKGMYLVFYDNLKKACEMKGMKVTPTVLECGGKAGSIGGWKKGASPNSDIVMKIAERLNVSTDFLLFGKQEYRVEQSEDEYRLVQAYRKLTDEGKRAVLSFAEMASENPQYQKYTDVPKEA